ncbi:MAG TPA: hypothetical protein VN316_01300 [candidate division Zixibacteria bacterium]|nr:hypothetical protein [candidate division Zixibacteria bacterium]
MAEVPAIDHDVTRQLDNLSPDLQRQVLGSIFSKRYVWKETTSLFRYSGGRRYPSHNSSH